MGDFITVRFCSYLLMLAGVCFLDKTRIKCSEIFDFEPYPECTEGTLLPLPHVAAQFSVKMERTAVSWDTQELRGGDAVESYYDSHSQQGATVLNLLHSHGARIRWMWDFKNDQSYFVTENLTCVPMPAVGFSACTVPFAVFLVDLFAMTNPTYPTVKVSERCNFSVTHVTFIREETVRSIPVRVWRQCTYDGRLNKVTLHYYYSAKGGGPLGLFPDKPIRFESRVLTANHTASEPLQTMDVTHYVDGIDDPSVFLPPPGAFCSTWLKRNKAIPSFPLEAALSLTVVSLISQKIHRMTISVDRMNEQIQFYTDPPKAPSANPSNIKRNLTESFVTLHDHQSGLEFVITYRDSFTRKMALTTSLTCHVSVIDHDGLVGHWKDDWDSQKINAHNAYQLFKMINYAGWIYIGERDFEGVPCYIWSRQQVPRDTDLIAITEVYWLKEEWSPVNMSTFYGMIRYQKASNGTMLEIYKAIVTAYVNLIDDFYHQLDIYSGVCLRTPESRPLFLSFTVQLKDRPVWMVHQFVFLLGLRNALSELLDTSVLRMTDMEARLVPGNDPKTANRVTIWMTILEWVKKKTEVGAREELPSQQVIERFVNILNGSDLHITVHYQDKSEIVTLLGNTIRAETAPFSSKLTNSSSRTNLRLISGFAAGESRQNGYTSGDMTGLAFAMILTTAGAGFVGGYFSPRLLSVFR